MDLQGNKRRLCITVALLLVCALVLASASYAWLSMSQSPEIVGVDINIGANGSLEIALLTTDTYIDPSLIRTSIGDSAVIQDAVISNLTWGNVLDLSDLSYGLHNISLMPARLNIASEEAENAVIGGSILSIPSFGTDGRIDHIKADTLTAVYQDDGFYYFSEEQDYGVRAIGTSSRMTAQQTALAGARTLLRSYTAAAISATESTWVANGSAMMDIFVKRYAMNADTFDDSHVAVLRDTATRMLSVLGYLDSGLRQGIIGFAASELSDEEDFHLVQKIAEDTTISLPMILESVSIQIPSDIVFWSTTVERERINLKKVISDCDALSGGGYSWKQISDILQNIIDPDKCYLGDEKITSGNLSSQISADMQLTLAPSAGIMATIADFAGNYSVEITYTQASAITVKTASTVGKPYLEQILDILESSEAASDTVSREAVLSDIYGYVIDMALRCNTDTDLLLQTDGTNRKYGDTATTGDGSNMRFQSNGLSEEQMVYLMDAIRIGFIDNRNNLLAVGKLSTHAYEQTENGISAPIYLYNYTVSQDGSISMGERMEKDSSIMQLSADCPTVLSVVVWLDGDHVDNTLVGHLYQSMTGTLNLQFGSCTQLQASDIPMED